MPRRISHLLPLVSLLIPLLIAGCSSDERLVDLSQQSLERQAEQNLEMAHQSQTVADTTHDLVGADAQARQEILAATRELQAEQAHIERQHEGLNQERRELARARQTEPLIANAIQNAALLVAVLLPLVLALFLIRGLYRSDNSEALNELLIAELASETSSLLPAPASTVKLLEHQPTSPTTDGNLLSAPVTPVRERTLRKSHDKPRVIVVVEGVYDVSFLERVSAMLHVGDPGVPDLGELSDKGLIVFVPTSGGDLANWTHRLSGFGQAEFHLYDRELPPLTTEREQVVQAINRRPNCVGLLTRKRSIENYLHSEAIRAALHIDVPVGDHDDVVETVARQKLLASDGDWSKLSRSTRKRLRDLAKRQLHNLAVDRMTPELLAERDPEGEVRGWFEMIASLAQRRES